MPRHLKKVLKTCHGGFQISAKIRNLIGFAPTLELPAILRTVIDYHQKKMEWHEEVHGRRELAESLLKR
jgi:hypothetical protein